jgi:acetyl-CoA carboxylase carboxyl transferase subunit alpha
MGEYYLEFEKTVQEIDKSISELKKAESKDKGIEFSTEIAELEKRRDYILDTIYKNLSPWQVV